MALELNRATFRRLVQFYLLLLPIGVAAFVIELITGPWLAFSNAFDALAAQHFGPDAFVEDAPSWPLALLLSLFAWMVASTIGLLWFRRWARFGAWASVLGIVAGMMMIDGYRPSYTSPVLDVFTIINGTLGGAILLLAYGKGYGADWFAPSANFRD